MTTSPDRSTIRITEAVYQDVAPQIDREAGIIRRVKILGRKSDNGRVYSDQAIKEAAALYNNVKVNIDHPQGEKGDVTRPLADTFGTLRDIDLAEDGVYGNLHYLKSHPLAETVCEAAERMPTQLGLSHNAEGRITSDDKQDVVESVECVYSVDLVSRPATNYSLFESATMPNIKLSDAVKTQVPGANPATDETVQPKPKTPASQRQVREDYGTMDQMQEDDPADFPDTDPGADMPSMDDDAEEDDEITVDSVFQNLIGLIGSADIDSEVRKELMGNVLDLQDKINEAMTGKTVKEDDEEQTVPAMKADAQESRRGKRGNLAESKVLAVIVAAIKDMRRELREQTERSRAHSLCAQYGVIPSPTMINAVAALKSDDQRREFLESADAHRRIGPKLRSRSLTESAGTKQSDIPLDDPKKLATFLRK